MSKIIAPAGFEVPPDAIERELRLDDELFVVQSQLLAIMDLSRIDDVVQSAATYISGANIPPAWICTTAGTLCRTGQDGPFQGIAYVYDDRVYAVDVLFDELVNADRSTWLLAGLSDAATGVAVLGDPSLLDQYAHDPFEPPLAAYGVWTVLALPAPGLLAIHVLKRDNNSESDNLALRATWLPTSRDETTQ